MLGQMDEWMDAGMDRTTKENRNAKIHNNDTNRNNNNTKLRAQSVFTNAVAHENQCKEKQKPKKGR